MANPIDNPTPNDGQVEIPVEFLDFLQPTTEQRTCQSESNFVRKSVIQKHSSSDRRENIHENEESHVKSQTPTQTCAKVNKGGFIQSVTKVIT